MIQIPRSHAKTYLLIAILVIAAILRLNHITQPFTGYASWRETSTAMMADNFYRRNWNIFYPEVSWNGPDPSYQGREFQTVTYIAAILYTFVGQQDWVGRGVAMIFGLWGIFALYQLVRRVWDEEHALVGAAVMAVLPGSIFIERSFLPDPVMVALVTTAFWMFVVYLQTERWPYLLLAGIIGAWGFLTKIPGLIIGLPMAYAIWAIWRHRVWQRKKLVTLGCFAILMLAPVAAYYLWARHLSLTYPPYHFAGSDNWLWDYGVREWLKEKYFLRTLSWNFNRWIWTKPVIALFMIGFFLPPPQWSYNSRPDPQLEANSGKAPWVFHWWMLAGGIFYLIGAKELVINSWNFHIINPAAAVLVGHAIIRTASITNRFVQSPASWATVAAILLIICGFGQKKLQVMYYPPEPHWDATESYKLGMALRQISKPDDLVVTIPNDVGEPVAIYYSQRRGWGFPPPWPGVVWWSGMPEDDNEAIRLLEELRAEGADWLGIVNERRGELWKKTPIFGQHIERTCELVQESPDWVIYRILTPQEVANLAP